MQVTLSPEFIYLATDDRRYNEICKTVFGYRGWEPSFKSWRYTNTPESAYSLYTKFETLFKSGKINYPRPDFPELVKQGRELSRLRIALVDGVICVRAPFELKDTCKSIPGWKWNSEIKTWDYPATAAHAQAIKEALGFLFTGALLDPAFLSLLPKEETPEYKSKTRAWKHQIEAYNAAYNLPGYMLSFGMGAGKTKVAVDLFCNRGHKRGLIFGPKAIIEEGTWSKQFALHGITPVKVFEPTKGTVAQKVKEIKAFFAQAGATPAVVVLNYEAAWRPGMAEFLAGSGADIVIFDEIHKIKAPGGKASKFCFALSKRIPYRLGLTGTPMPNGPRDLYAQFRALDTSVFGTTVAGFEDKYLLLGQYGETIGYKNEQELNRKFYSRAYRVKTEEAVDLPEKVEITLHHELGPAALKAYRELEATFTTLVKDERVSVTNKLTQMLRFQQITGGYLPYEAGERPAEIDTSKIELLGEVLEGLDENEPVVIFCKFSPDIDRVHRLAMSLGRKSLELSGRRNDIKEWQAGGAPILAVQIQAGGAGITLTRAHYVVYYSTGYNNGDYEQSLFRAYRPGQNSKTIIYHLVAKNTIDEDIAAALIEKQSVAELILSKYGAQEAAA